MVRIRTVVLLTAVVLLTGSCGGGRSHLEVLRPLTREYQELTEYLKLVESTEELGSLDAPSAQVEADVVQMRAQLDSASKACRNRLRRVLRIEGVPQILECLQKLPGGTG